MNIVEFTTSCSQVVLTINSLHLQIINPHLLRKAFECSHPLREHMNICPRTDLKFNLVSERVLCKYFGRKWLCFITQLDFAMATPDLRPRVLFLGHYFRLPPAAEFRYFKLSYFLCDRLRSVTDRSTLSGSLRIFSGSQSISLINPFLSSRFGFSSGTTSFLSITHIQSIWMIPRKGVRELL